MHVLDLLFGIAVRSPRFFEDGWGDRALVEAVDPAALVAEPPARIDLALGPPVRALGGVLYEGAFESPFERLPPGARRARVRLLLPERGTRGVALHLAASGDQGFAIRLRFAAPLLAHGIGALVLENAYYGARRPAAQRAHVIRSLADLHAMGAATLAEGRALLRWIRDHGFPRAGVTGYSMGGQMAAMVGASVPFPAAVVPVAPTLSPDSVLLRGVFRDVADWRALAGPGEEREDARAVVCGVLARFSVARLPPPREPRAAIVIGAARDGVVPPRDAARIAAHWGSELRWIRGGHVSAVLRHRDEMRAAIVDAFARLPRRRAARKPHHAGRGAPLSRPLALAAWKGRRELGDHPFDGNRR